VETGTFRGTTTRFLAQACPGTAIRSVELSPRSIGFARRNVREFPAVRLERGDSRAVLKELVEEHTLCDQRAFFYLDAHWGHDLPVVGELTLVFDSFRHAVVAIDDFQVPGDPGYGHDYYGEGRELTLAALGSTIERYELAVFFPRLPSSEESGKRTGLAVLARNAECVAMLRDLGLLRESASVPSLASREHSGA
jgi:predicted O-methyltransferase YrrM